MSKSDELVEATGGVREEFLQSIASFEALERRLLAEERRERARTLNARFAELNLQIGEK